MREEKIIMNSNLPCLHMHSLTLELGHNVTHSCLVLTILIFATKFSDYYLM